MEKLVTILTPCYNGAKYIDRYAKSLLDQDYSNCQLIFMDDGSTDNSKEMIYSYKELFESKGFTFEYYFHENIGLGGTIAKGIKYVKGEYLIWPDVDDTLVLDSIKKKVDFLEAYPEYGLVRTKYIKHVESNDGYIDIIGPTFKFDHKKEFLFEDYLLSKGAWLLSGCFMLRMTAFDEANPDRYIYPTRRGQNWQMLLPIMYNHKCGFIDEPLYVYNIHSGCMSNTSHDTLDVVVKRYDMYEELLVETIKHMNISNLEKYIDMVHNHYLREKIGAALDYSNKEVARLYHNELKERNALTFKSLVKYYLVFMPKIYSLIKRIRKI